MLGKDARVNNLDFLYLINILNVQSKYKYKMTSLNLHWEVILSAKGALFLQ